MKSRIVLSFFEQSKCRCSYKLCYYKKKVYFILFDDPILFENKSLSLFHVTLCSFNFRINYPYDLQDSNHVTMSVISALGDLKKYVAHKSRADVSTPIFKLHR